MSTHHPLFWQMSEEYLNKFVLQKYVFLICYPANNLGIPQFYFGTDINSSEIQINTRNDSFFLPWKS